MSLIFTIKDDDSNLPDIISLYEGYLINAVENLDIKGKTLQNANLEQASWMSYYDERRVELHTLVKHYEAKLAKVKGTLWASYTENYSIALQATDKTQYIAKEPRYLEINQLLMIVQELYDKYCSLVEAYKARGFALRNITNIRVAALEDVIL